MSLSFGNRQSYPIPPFLESLYASHRIKAVSPMSGTPIVSPDELMANKAFIMMTAAMIGGLGKGRVVLQPRCVPDPAGITTSFPIWFSVAEGVAEIRSVEDAYTAGSTGAGIMLGRISTGSVITTGHTFDSTVITSVQLARGESLFRDVPQLEIAADREAMALLGMVDHRLSGRLDILPRFEMIEHHILDD